MLQQPHKAFTHSIADQSDWNILVRDPCKLSEHVLCVCGPSQRPGTCRKRPQHTSRENVQSPSFPTGFEQPFDSELWANVGRGRPRSAWSSRSGPSWRPGRWASSSEEGLAAAPLAMGLSRACTVQHVPVRYCRRRRQLPGLPRKARLTWRLGVFPAQALAPSWPGMIARDHHLFFLQCMF